MNVHLARTTSALGAVVAAGLILAAPSAARGTVAQPQVPASPCNLPWTNVIYGTALADELVGTSANDLIIGYGGGDTISGLGGRDTILGGAGADVIAGGPGDDCVDGGAGTDESWLYYYTESSGTDASYSVSFRYSY